MIEVNFATSLCIKSKNVKVNTTISNNSDKTKYILFVGPNNFKLFVIC